jgi:hypothetical protein
MIPKNTASNVNGADDFVVIDVFQYNTCKAVSKMVMGIRNSIQYGEMRTIPADAAQSETVCPNVKTVTKSTN